MRAGALWCLCLTLVFGGGAVAVAAAQDADAHYVTARRLMEQGAYAEALPLIEALVSEDPSNKIYRFRLALVLAELRRDLRATFHLEQLRGADLNSEERVLVGQVLNKIATRKVWGVHFSFNLKPESNGVKQTETRQLVVGGLPVVLNDTAIGKPTVSGIVNTGFSYTPTIAPGLKAQFSLGAYLKHNDDVSLRDHQITARAGLLTQDPSGSFWSGGMLVGARRVADAPYSQTLGLYGTHGAGVGQAGFYRLGAEVSRDHLRDGRPDQERVFLTGSYAHAIGTNAQISFGGFLERNLSNTKSLDGLRAGLNLTGLYAFKGGLITGLTLRGEVDDRNGVNAAFGVVRSDRKLAVELAVYHRDFRIGVFAPQVKLGVERNRSNIALADYTNRYLSFGFTRNF